MIFLFDFSFLDSNNKDVVDIMIIVYDPSTSAYTCIKSESFAK